MRIPDGKLEKRWWMSAGGPLADLSLGVGGGRGQIRVVDGTIVTGEFLTNPDHLAQLQRLAPMVRATERMGK